MRITRVKLFFLAAAIVAIGTATVVAVRTSNDGVITQQVTTTQAIEPFSPATSTSLPTTTLEASTSSTVADTSTASSATSTQPTKSSEPEQQVAAKPISGNKVAVPEYGAYIGMSAGDPANGISIESREAQFGQKMSIERIFVPNQHWNLDRINIKRIVQAHEAGRIPMVSYKIDDLKATTRGEHDAIIDRLALQIKDSKIPILLTFNAEPEDEACNNNQPGCGKPHTSADFVKMWRHIHGRFAAKGVNNVSWNWIIMGWQTTNESWAKTSTRTQSELQKLNQMYPGDSYVDWISGDIYNGAGDCYVTSEQIHKRWRLMSLKAQGWYEWGSAFGKPLALAEWGTFHDELDPGAKARWYEDARTTFKSWPNVKAYTYFDKVHEGCDWRIDKGGQAGLDAYKKLFNDPYFIKG